MSDARCALIADAGGDALAAVALRLLRLGIDVHYARDADEAWLLADQEASRIRVVAFPPNLAPADVTRVVDCLARGAPEVTRSLLVIGPRPADDVRQSLRELDVEFALWDALDDSALRAVFGMAMAVWPEVGSEVRRHPRAPVNLLGRAFVGTRRRDVVISSLSVGGAFLETPTPFPEETPISIEVPLPEGDTLLKGKVVYAHFGSDDQQRPCGMGVEFAPPNVTLGARLRRYLEAQEKQFRV